MKICVVSARSGTGKTLVATSLVLSLSNEKSRLQLLDCNVERPDAHRFLKPSFSRIEQVSIQVPEFVKERCTYCGKCGKVCAYNAIITFAKNVLTFPDLCRGCGACSYVCSQGALILKSRQIGVIESGKANNISLVHGRLNPGGILPLPLIGKIRDREFRQGTIIVDTIAGASDQVARAIEGSDFGLLVAIPDTTGNQPLNRVTETLKRLDMPCGAMLNFSGPGDSEIEEYCAIKEIPVLLKIPEDFKIARDCSGGIAPAAVRPEWQGLFPGLFSKIMEIVGERNSSTKR